MTSYTNKELDRKARIAIKESEKTSKIKTKCIGWTLIIYPPDTIGGTTLVAHGQRMDSGDQFDCYIAI